MKRLVLAVGVATAACVAVQVTAGAEASGPAALVSAEHAFAADVAANGIRAGFLAHLAPTAVVLSPGPVNAVKWYAALKPSPAKLAWEPAVAVMSGAGDLGWTCGPWQWRSDSTKSGPDATGTFVTLWRRQVGGVLKAVLDVGVSHAAPANDPPALESRALTALPGSRDPQSLRRGLWKADADFTEIASTRGLPAAIGDAAAAQLRWLREGARPVMGRDAARDSAAATHAAGRMVSNAQYVSDGGDLGYTYGTWVEGGSAAPDSSYYLHIWERAAGHPWQLVLELFSPVPKRKR
jgi:hypothetical protein